LKLLEVNKSPELDGRLPTVLREMSDIICAPLAICKKSLQLGIFPEIWRIFHVVPIHKSASQYNVADFWENANENFILN